jgi:hypothetical protein
MDRIEGGNGKIRDSNVVQEWEEARIVRTQEEVVQ